MMSKLDDDDESPDVDFGWSTDGDLMIDAWLGMLVQSLWLKNASVLVEIFAFCSFWRWITPGRKALLA